MYTKSGILYLGKREREALRVLVEHSKRDIGYNEGGTFNKEDNFDSKEAKKAELGHVVIDFILEITK